MARIVVVDEDKYIRQLYYSEFSEIGHEVLTAASGFELMGKLEAFGPDLIITDVKPGDYDGNHMLRQIRDLAPGIPVVVCSAYDFSRWNIGAPAADCHVVKSFDLTELKAKAERALQAKTRFLSAV